MRSDPARVLRSVSARGTTGPRCTFRCTNDTVDPLAIETPESRRKARLDALLLALPGVSGKTINGLAAYLVTDRMFACISGNGVGLRLPVAMATELQFARNDVVAFQPGGMASTREWIQINRADADDFAKDLSLFQASLEFVRGGRGR
jgi:hypothetical protein